MRSYGATANALLEGEHLVECHLLAFFLDLYVFPGQPPSALRYNTSSTDLEYGGYTWYAGHGLFDIKFPLEDGSLDAHGAVVTLAAMNPSMLALALAARVKGKTATIYHCVMDPETFAIVSVQMEFSGRISTMGITSGAFNA